MGCGCPERGEWAAKKAEKAGYPRVAKVLRKTPEVTEKIKETAKRKVRTVLRAKKED